MQEIPALRNAGAAGICTVVCGSLVYEIPALRNAVRYFSPRDFFASGSFPGVLPDSAEGNYVLKAITFGLMIFLKSARLILSNSR